MASPSSRHMFGQFTYQKSIDQITVAMKKKIEQLREMISERERRIAKIREDNDISQADMTELMYQASQRLTSNVSFAANATYSLNTRPAGPQPSEDAPVRLIAAGVVQNITTEKDIINTEKASIRQLTRIVDNIAPITLYGDNGEEYTQSHFDLDFSELKFLGF